MTLWFWGTVVATWVALSWFVVRLVRRRERRARREAAIADRLAADEPAPADGQEDIPPAGPPLDARLVLRPRRDAGWRGVEMIVILLVVAIAVADHAQGYGALLRWIVFYPLALLAGLAGVTGAIMAVVERRDRVVATPLAIEVIEGVGVRRHHAWSSIVEARIERRLARGEGAAGGKAGPSRLVLAGAGGRRLEEFDHPMAPPEAYRRLLAAIPAHTGKPVTMLDL